MMKPITLLTDFGLDDWFVGTMKGVILRIAADCRIVDLTHGIDPGDIFSGAFSLAASYRYFAKGTIHVAVVDPGVGSSRGAIAIATENYIFVGPDNGVLSVAVAGETVREVRRLENSKFFLDTVSRTFHGRDLFAPVAARLSAGAGFEELGPEVTDYVRIEIPSPKRHGDDVITGEVIYIDRFGNAITNLREEHLGNANVRSVKIPVASGNACRVPIENCYQAVPAENPVALIGSSGFLEIAIRDGNAAQQLKLQRGSSVELC